jgi:hypothetical protein
MVKHDRAYADWQARTARREARETDRLYGWEMNELSFGGESHRTHSVNQTSRRAGKSTAAQADRTETITMKNGASFTFAVFDEASQLSPAEQLDQKPVFDPLAAYAHAEKHGGKSLTGTQKRKVFAAEKARHENRLQQWEDRMTAQEIEAMQIELSRDSLGFGDW